MSTIALRPLSSGVDALFDQLEERQPSALTNALGAFYFDVLVESDRHRPARAWGSPTSAKQYRALKTADGRRQRPIRPSDVLAHVTGDVTTAASPIQRAIVVDVDLASVLSGREATIEAKRAGADVVELVLGSFGIPFLTFDAARGTHTWIRLANNPSEALLAALRRLLRDAGTRRGVRAEFEVFPHGNSAIRLPLGTYLGVERRPFGVELEEDDLLGWFTRPLRPTTEQLEALISAAPPEPKPDLRPVAVSPPEQPALHRPTTTAACEPLPDPPGPIVGWERWPACKRALVVGGFAPGLRHAGLLALANEATLSGETSEERIFSFLLSVPRPHSTTPDAQHRSDARAAARAALKLHATDDPRRFSGCGRAANHSGLPDGATQRSAFDHLCTPERAASCPLHVQHRRSYDLAPFAVVLNSSIWRDGRGQYGKGLGQQTKAVYSLLAGKSQGDPERTVYAAKDWVALALINDIGERMVSRHLSTLVRHGLVIEQRRGENEIRRFTVPHRDAAWIRSLEERLGTRGVVERQRTRLLTEIEKRRQRPYLSTK